MKKILFSIAAIFFAAVSLQGETRTLRADYVFCGDSRETHIYLDRLQDARPTVQLDSLERRYNFYTQWCAPEKLYLHMDRAYYAYGETIWFNGYLANSTTRALLPTSNYIYVELLDSKGENVVRVKVKRDPDSGFPGHLAIPDNIASGFYTLRAYTLWNLNNPADYMFHQRIKILGQEPPKKAVEPSAGKIDVSFYPEGGRYFTGCKSTIGLKVISSRGQSVDTRGWLVDGEGRNIAPFVTSHDGMGAVEFVPIPGRSYSINIDGKLFPLPAPSPEGVVVKSRFSGDFVFVTVSGVTPGRYRLFVRDASEVSPLATIDFRGRDKYFKIPLASFRGGINHLLLASSEGTIVSERLLYIPDAPAPRCTLTPTASRAMPRELLRCDVSLTTPEGAPLDGRFSVSVVRGSFGRYQQNDDIISYMRLSSELRGTINSPSYYFDESLPRDMRTRDLDLLMMVQGWRYYDMEQVEKTDNSSFKLKYLKEMFQTIRGRIDRVLSTKVPKKFIFTVVIPRIKYTAIEEVEQARYFDLEDLDIKENTGILIKVNRLDGGIDYMPKWNGDIFAPPFKYAPAMGEAGHQAASEKIPLEANLAMTDTLQAAVVVAKVNPFPNIFGGRTVTSSDLEAYGSYNLVDYVKMVTAGFEYSDGRMASRRHGHGGGAGGVVETEEGSEDDMSVGESEGGGGGATVKLVVDDSEQQWEMFETVQMDDVEAINISTSPDFLYGAPGGLVTVKMKAGVQIERDFTLQRSMAYFVPLGYQSPKAFYSPRYDKGDTSEFFDNRNTVFWSPFVSVTGGKGVVEFCNTDQMDYPYIVRIEGVTSSGDCFSCYTLLEYK